MLWQESQSIAQYLKNVNTFKLSIRWLWKKKPTYDSAIYSTSTFFPRVIICPKKDNIEIGHRIDNLFKFNSYLIDTITWFAHEELNLNFEFARILQHKKTEFGKLGVNIIHMRQFPANS